MASPLLTPSFWRDRPVFVTGGSGLVGGAVIEALLDLGASVVCLWRDDAPQTYLRLSGMSERVTKVRGELEDRETLERIINEYEVKTVIHLAAQAIVTTANRNPLSTFESNVRGSYLLLEACRNAPLISEIIVASSDKAYGDQPILPYTEEMPLLARTPYDVSKACTDMIAQSYARTFDMPIAIARCGNFFGEGDLNWNRIIPGAMRSILRNEPPVIRSNGTLVRDYFYVRDGAAAYLLLAEKLATNPALRGEAFNFSSGACFSVLEITQKVLDIAGSSLTPVVLGEARNEILKQHLSSTKAKDLLGWEPRFSLEEGLKKTMEWYRGILNTHK